MKTGSKCLLDPTDLAAIAGQSCDQGEIPPYYVHDLILDSHDGYSFLSSIRLRFRLQGTSRPPSNSPQKPKFRCLSKIVGTTFLGARGGVTLWDSGCVQLSLV